MIIGLMRMPHAFKAADFAGSWMTLEGQQEDLPSLVRRCMEWQHGKRPSSKMRLQERAMAIA